jgi:ribosomal protein S18 acetylase RimI-like enzyme
MMDIVEEEARSMEKVNEIALDTAETAYHLIDFYKKRGYRYIETIKWDATNYKSVVLSKSLYSH